MTMRGTIIDQTNQLLKPENIYNNPGNIEATQEFAGQIGTYGDGGLVPRYIWDSLISDARKHTAYCHQYDNPNSSFDPTIYMVSADNLPTAQRHWDFGHRTFRVIQDVNEVVKGQEILCPASKEMGRRVQCSSCMLCGGSQVNAKSIAIVQH